VPFVDVGGGRLWYEEEGRGRAVVFLHSSLVDSRMWEPQTASFAWRYRAIRIDARGWGRSDRPDAPWSPVDDLLRALAALGVDRAALIGASMGGRTALDAALARPEMVAALVLVVATVGGFDQWGAELRAMWEEQESALDRGDRDRALELDVDFWVRPGLGVTSARRIRKLARDNLHVYETDEDLLRRPEPAIDHLGEIRAPTLVLIPEDDVPEIRRCGEIMAGGIPGARKALVPGDHHPNLRDPQAFDHAVLGFLSEVLT
jgi:pimeloyl-ACP methyl ester carboxylesterase